MISVLTLERIYENMNVIQSRIDDYEQLKKVYNDFVKNLDYKKISSKSVPPKILWSCWLQGIENAPELVQRCHYEREKRYTQFEHILITQNNFTNYISLNPIILEKWRDGIIPNTAFSNLIRLQVLEEYGGIWLDGTVLCATDEFPLYMIENPLFFFSSWTWITVDIRPLSTWFISSCIGHPFIHMTKLCLEKYWIENDKLVTYFIFHMFCRMIIAEHPELMESVPRFSNVPPHLMQFELSKTYNEHRYKELLQMAPIHKLTYKLDSKIKSDAGNLYSHIVNQGIDIDV